jgi:hypothetical protein
MEKIYSMYNMEGYMTRYLANLRLGTPTHRVAKKTALLRFFEQFFAKQNFFKITLWGVSYARNRLRALKNLQNASLAMKSSKI